MPRHKKLTKNRSSPLAHIDVAILCGGQGTRLRSVVGDRQKVLAPFGKRPFMDILLDYLLAHGFARFILCAGYLAAGLRERYRKNPHIIISEETEPLGTGGALRNARSHIESEDMLVLNGDSIYKDFDPATFYDFHTGHDGFISIALTTPRSEGDCGTVSIGPDGRVIGFMERKPATQIRPATTAPAEKVHMNSGLYFMNRKVFDLMPAEKFSLEYDFFPRFVNGESYGFVSEGELIDIGTPERYEKAQLIFSGAPKRR